MLTFVELTIAPGQEFAFAGQAGTMRLQSTHDGRTRANWWYAKDVAKVAEVMRAENPGMEISVIIDAPAPASEGYLALS
ncbi:hypothetical protein [Zavarzinia sp. CC-PAN008]|uniref:hypothetical protein n=1 Tax=Zavarzinia sp. CC-PAN008 TaxID=3243332 RepID=UPI003F744FA7